MPTGPGAPLALYCPDVPPVPGGVSDHTLVLARALAARGAPPRIIALRGDPQAFAPLPCELGVRPGDLAAAVARAGAAAVLIQYVPFLFARFGIARSLARAADRLAAAGVRIGLFLHEPYVPLTRLPWLVTGWPQRRQLRHLVRRAACVYAPVPRYAAIARSFARPDTTVRTVPIGATHPVSTVPRETARRTLGIPDDQVVVGVFSPAAAGFNQRWIRIAAQRLAGRAQPLWLLFGHGSAAAARLVPPGAAVRALGTIPDERLGLAMRALDVAAQPYVDGLTMRRSGAMLALAHGVPVVSSTGHLFDPDCGAVTPCAASADAFAERLAELVTEPERRAEWAARAAAARHLWSAEVLTGTILADFGAPQPAPRGP